MDHLEPKAAHQYLRDHPDAVFIDCRSEMEYMFVGHPIGAMMVPWYDGAVQWTSATVSPAVAVTPVGALIVPTAAAPLPRPPSVK